MSVNTFAAIDVGSYELSMKIFEVSKHSGMRQIDHIVHGIDLGTETYATGKLSMHRIDELCDLLSEFAKIMKSYKVSKYRAYGTSAIRETVNTTILLSQIKQRTGIDITVLNNSEQRFLDYKSIAFQGEKFNKFIEKETAIYDVGGGSMQISLFSKDTLISTQNMKLGVLRMLERMNTMGASMRRYEDLVGELSSTQLSTYAKLYLKDREIENLIIVDDYISTLINRGNISGVINNVADASVVDRYIEKLKDMGKNELSKTLSVSQDDIPLLYISFILLQQVMKTTGAKTLWAPGVTLCDGIAYEFAEENGIIKSTHDFAKDIRSCAMQISKRYMGSSKRASTLENISLTLFDATVPIHGLGERDRLLLQISTLLHDCGKYISLSNLAECSYNIIMSTEIIGLSHKERMIIANVVKYNQMPFEYYEELSSHESIEMEDHMRIAKLTALLRLSNGLDRSHKMKFKNVTVSVKEGELIIEVRTDADISLEKGLFGNRADFFTEVFNLKPVIKQIRSF